MSEVVGKRQGQPKQLTLYRSFVYRGGLYEGFEEYFKELSCADFLDGHRTRAPTRAPPGCLRAYLCFGWMIPHGAGLVGWMHFYAIGLFRTSDRFNARSIFVSKLPVHKQQCDGQLLENAISHNSLSPSFCMSIYHLFIFCWLNQPGSAIPFIRVVRMHNSDVN